MLVTLQLESYIACPYWPEQATLIEIGNKVHPKLGPAKRAAAISSELQRLGISEEEHQRMLDKVKERWYKKPDGTIFIPRHQIAGMLVQAVKVAPKAIRSDFAVDSFRSAVKIKDFETTKTQKDGDYNRYIKHDKTNMRRYCSDEFIEDFAAIGEITLAPIVLEEDFLRLFTYAIQLVGVGSARKMGYGRGILVQPALARPLVFDRQARAVNEEEE